VAEDAGFGRIDERDPALRELGRDIAVAALRRGDFLLSSGLRSSYYLDKYLFETSPRILRRVAAFLGELMPAGVDRIAATELGGVPLATAISLHTDIPFVIVKKESKTYATSRLIEGEMSPGDRVVVVEDVITSGAQAIRSAQRCRDAGAQILGIVCVIDRQEGGTEAVAAAGYFLGALFTRASLDI
jgi:orotate phosphoribosyltransferase